MIQIDHRRSVLEHDARTRLSHRERKHTKPSYQNDRLATVRAVPLSFGSFRPGFNPGPNIGSRVAPRKTFLEGA